PEKRERRPRSCIPRPGLLAKETSERWRGDDGAVKETTDLAGTRDVSVFVEAVEVEDGLVGDNEEPDLFQGLPKETEDIGDEVEQPGGVEDDYLDVEEGSAASSDEAARETNPRIKKAMPGRPKKKRRNEAAELEARVNKNGWGHSIGCEGMVMHCSKCRGTRHNARKCPNSPFVPSEPVMETSKRAIHCGSCKQAGHNARKCPLNMGIQFTRVENVGVRSSAEVFDTQPIEIDATQRPTTQPE
ncbi:unnamed protein product, partial [Linum tenue]